CRRPVRHRGNTLLQGLREVVVARREWASLLLQQHDPDVPAPVRTLLDGGDLTGVEAVLVVRPVAHPWGSLTHHTPPVERSSASWVAGSGSFDSGPPASP